MQKYKHTNARTATIISKHSYSDYFFYKHTTRVSSVLCTVKLHKQVTFLIVA